MNKETLEQNIKSLTTKLLELARECCWNEISNDCVYIISEIKDSPEKNFNEQRIDRNQLNKDKTPKSFECTISHLAGIYSNLYDINLYVYKAEKKRTIVEIRYYPKSFLDIEYYEKVKNNEPMLHCKVSHPPYLSETNPAKFDINWEFGGMKQSWKMFWGRRKARKEMRRKINVW